VVTPCAKWPAPAGLRFPRLLPLPFRYL